MCYFINCLKNDLLIIQRKADKLCFSVQYAENAVCAITRFFISLLALLFLLSLFFFTGAFTDEDVIQAPLGGSATFNLKVTRNMKVSLAEWSRCPDQKVFVFSPSHGLTIVNNSYAGRLFAKSNHSIVLEKLQESDFVTYCYKLSTFPQGSLQGQINLVKRTEKGKIIFLYITGMLFVS